jgi:peptide/nickel transport system permease protein
LTSIATPADYPLPRRRGGDAVLRLLRRPAAAIAAGVVALLVFGAVAAPLVAPYAEDAFNYENLHGAPTLAHPFGTDELGRDLLTRILYAGRTSLQIAGLATALAIGLGAVWGFVAAFMRGWVDDALMRGADLTLGMPAILIGLVLVAAFGSSTMSLVLILGIVFAPGTARLARSALLTELETDYYVAARSVGAPSWQIVLKELFPNTTPVLLARSSLVAAEVIFVEASLSFVGLGVQPPQASWGTLLESGYGALYSSIWYPLFPALVILVAVLALNVLGDNLQRVLDPSRR